MKTRIISIIIAGLLVLSAIGCGGQDTYKMDIVCYNCRVGNTVELKRGEPVGGTAITCDYCGYRGYLTEATGENQFGLTGNIWVIYAY